MKKLLFFAAFAAFAFVQTANAQREGFSLKAGYNNVNIDIDGLGSDSEGGIYFGAGYQFSLSETFDFEPSALFSIVEDLNALYVPMMFKYYVADKINLQGGPQINYILEDDVDDGKFGIDLAGGVGFDFTSNFSAEVRYGFEVIRDLDDVNINTFTIGIGYRFN
ncbi:porin family protein [Leptobacterium sp. I13]|uniref:porin family protein n=1 Tax=Leptobacterium meishanense TaxID=3128904 RepID=UPI0030EE3425